MLLQLSPLHLREFEPPRYGSLLNPYSKTVPAVIAKASAIYNPFIYAIIHSKYRWDPLNHQPKSVFGVI